MSEETRFEAGLDEAIADGRPVRSFLDDEETPVAVMRGTMLDSVRGRGDDSERSRTMTAEPGGIVALVTDRRVRFLVDRGDRVEETTVPSSAVDETVVETMGDALRLTVRTEEGPGYTFYPDEDAAGAVRAAADALGSAGADDREDAMDRLERLADLHERGALTDEEFAAKKRELLDRI
jgi:hypothetical protein